MAFNGLKIVVNNFIKFLQGSLWDSSEKSKIGARVLSQPIKYKN